MDGELLNRCGSEANLPTFWITEGGNKEMEYCSIAANEGAEDVQHGRQQRLRMETGGFKRATCSHFGSSNHLSQELTILLPKFK